MNVKHWTAVKLATRKLRMDMIYQVKNISIYVTYDAVFFRRDQTFARFSGRGLQTFIAHFGLFLNLRDVEFAGPFCFGKN